MRQYWKKTNSSLRRQILKWSRHFSPRATEKSFKINWEEGRPPRWEVGGRLPGAAGVRRDRKNKLVHNVQQNIHRRKAEQIKTWNSHLRLPGMDTWPVVPWTPEQYLILLTVLSVIDQDLLKSWNISTQFKHKDQNFLFTAPPVELKSFPSFSFSTAPKKTPKT